MSRNFELEKMRYEREQNYLALDKATNELDLEKTQELIKVLDLEPAELKELQSKTSQLPNLHKQDPKRYDRARELAECVNKLVFNSKIDKSDSQNSFLTSSLTQSSNQNDVK